MRSVQVSKPKGPLEIVEREIPEPGKYESKSKHVAFVTAIPLASLQNQWRLNEIGYFHAFLQAIEVTARGPLSIL